METIDLFENLEKIEDEELINIIDYYSNFEELTYEQCKEFLNQVEKIGYTFDYYLDAVPYNLRPKTTKVVKEYLGDGKLHCEYEVLQSNESIMHGKCNFYALDGSYAYCSWWFKGEFLGYDTQGEKEFLFKNKNN